MSAAARAMLNFYVFISAVVDAQHSFTFILQLFDAK